MSHYLIGAANIAVGLFLHLLISGRIRRTEASLEYWSNWRARHPAFSGYGPAFLVAFGALRIAFGVLG
jgi:hypothetical protein